MVFMKGMAGLGTLSAAQGAELVDLLAAGHNVTVSITEPKSAALSLHTSQNPLAGQMSSTSSWGLSWELDIKPQFSAPGTDIPSTHPLAGGKGGFSTSSGTSMASPLVAGIYALLGEALGTTDPKTLTTLLTQTAKPIPGIPVPQQGAGLIQAYSALKSPVLLNTTSLALNDTTNFIPTHHISLSNLSPNDITYALTHNPASTVYTITSSRLAPIPLDTAPSSASITFPSSITIPANSNAALTLTFSLPSNLDTTRLPLYSGHIAFSSPTSNLTLPYAGLASSLLDAELIEPPTLRHPNRTHVIPHPSSGDTLEEEEYPLVILTRNLGTKSIRMDLISLNEAENTQEVLGLKIAGSFEGFPKDWYPGRGGTWEVFRGGCG